ncbi:hypothetical protein P3T42_005543 [Paraburkholderia sp. GAS38]
MKRCSTEARLKLTLTLTPSRAPLRNNAAAGVR